MDLYAVILAGGSARRLGGVMKPALVVGGIPMIERVIAAVADARVRVVVGPDGLMVPDGVIVTREVPPGGGPVAAIASGVAAVTASGVAASAVGSPGSVATGHIAVLAGDLPLLDRPAITRLRTALSATAGADVAVYVDRDRRRQWLCGVWHVRALRDRLAEMSAGGSLAGGPLAGGSLAGASVRDMFATISAAEVVAEVAAGDELPPWFDCDTDRDIRRVEEWLSR
jgi:molybdopterin-guanine dinucleotide biosynthesis protein A